jgi:antitoxin MazE
MNYANKEEVMKASITQIGNSKGIIIPAHLLKQCGFDKDVSLEVKEDSLVISRLQRPRQGWKEAFTKAEAGEEELLLDGFDNDFDREGWSW